MTSNAHASETARPSKLVGFTLWIIAIAMMFAAVIYQRTTGPTYPFRGSFTTGGQTHDYKLVRSKETTSDALVAIPDAGETLKGQLFWRHYPLEEPFMTVALGRDTGAALAGVAESAREDLTKDLEGKFFAPLPRQPSAGKLEYYLVLEHPEGTTRIPESADENIIIRYKDPVPLGILLPHVIFMFFSILIGMRAGLSALFQPLTMRRFAWTALIGMTMGGMVLGPFVQKYAFGKFWTGFPWGYDLTDNKMLIMWIAWIIGCSTIGTSPKPKEGVGRAVMLIATLVMIGVYLIPHSMKGSELDYSKLKEGVPAHEAIGTGEK